MCIHEKSEVTQLYAYDHLTCRDHEEYKLRSQGELGLTLATSCMTLGNTFEPQFLL